ncbi:hypothetical protein ACFO5R_04730 [Halosolutus amylolyticus]|uniref:Uncharacterized protein n=1 Tax=Halosolutus amylolyticus TaxID=2932267 RepID=A0ABD5PL77_9EURY|nr:hypothetical protein [Halosolutus amylolyticus]
MKAGVLGIVDGTFDVVDSYTETVTADGAELDRCLEIDRVFSLPSGDMAFAGRAAAETRTDRPTTTIESGAIHVTERPRIDTKYTEFVGVPGEFVAVDSGDGTFAFDLIGAETDTSIERATLDLDGFFAARESATPWKAGFHGTGDNGMNGIFHGEDLRTSHDMDGLLANSSLNQVGLTYEYAGADVKMTGSRSGYVEIYRPSEFDSGQYLTYLREEIRPYVR